MYLLTLREATIFLPKRRWARRATQSGLRIGEKGTEAEISDFFSWCFWLNEAQDE